MTDPSYEAESGIAAGSTISHYRIVRRLGAGGMGEVFLAQDLTLDRQVALKFLLPEWSAQEEYRKRFLREAQTLASLEHPNIISVYEVSEHEGSPFFAMRYIEGHTLDNFARAHLLGVGEILNLAIAICKGLQAAHEQGITHRDLKPGNIMVDKSQRACILDFGLAAVQKLEPAANTDETITRLTMMGHAVGTVAYMAPEQLRGQAVDARADIFALGVTLYELATGISPFRGTSSAEIASSILRDEPASPVAISPQLPADLGRVIMRCLKKDPARRFRSVEDIRIELEDLQDALPHQQFQAAASSATRLGQVVEREFVLGAQLVRQLEHRVPAMIGDRMTYLDNGVISDTIAVVLHGMGLDQRSVADVLPDVPCRAIAPTLYGFGMTAKRRVPLSLDDHSILLKALMQHAVAQAQATNVLPVGISSGSDHLLRMLAAEPTMSAGIQGLLLLGVNLDVRTCINSRLFAEFAGESPEELLKSIKAAGSHITSLSEWLLVHAYQVQVLEKFGTDTLALRRYAEDIVEPFATRGHQPFVEWYRMATSLVRFVRFVFFKDETVPLDEILQKHLEEGILGERSIESVIVREDLSHMQLLQAPNVARMIREMLQTMP
jgi:predicted Ser/Thr protein kinase/pimeloyl-ACP methyl ester carboxylesterase